jgi:thiamine-monophosphate kinase
MSTESDFLQWVKQQQRVTPLVQVPAGDDLAILNWPVGDLLLVGVDQVLDGVHFDSAIHSPREIGIKAVNRNLSDCAAMGCLPAAALVSWALPTGAGVEYAKSLYAGLREAADAFDCQMVGGDTGSWNGRLAVSVTILGRSAGLKPITRQGASEGDGIYVTGALGGSILGRHMRFSPRVHEGRQLAASGVVTAMIDLSDGLSRDLPRLTRGATIDAQSVPIHVDAARHAANSGKADNPSALEHALHDGEDYELLYTARAKPPLGIRIGTVTAEGAYLLRQPDGKTAPLAPQGWEHAL